VQAAQQEATQILLNRHNIGDASQADFTTQSQQDILNSFNQITGALTVLLGSIAAISLVVGGIGIMNIMLVSVTERTREIGTRKAIGARRKDILWQFLIEAMTLTGIGGLCGLLIGWATTLLIRQFIYSYVPVWAPVAGFVASVGIGLIFGLWPAWKAARLDPIESLRYE
jgi:putative ABC transport system permease protein